MEKDEVILKEMGKSRTNIYQTTIENNNLIQKPLPSLVAKMHDWQYSASQKIDELLTDEEISFIKNNMKTSEEDSDIPTGHLTRVEKAYHFLNSGLKEGDTLNYNSIFRGFSREPDATENYIRKHFGFRDKLVIYRTNGNVPHYNITEHTNDLKEEKESWIETGKLKIDKITHYTRETHDMKKVMIENLQLRNYPEEAKHYGDEYIQNHMKYSNIDPTPRDVIFVDLSPAP